MRLWSLHPKYLDSAGLVALWREALLAQKVLQGLTKGYVNHPQLIRFRNNNPLDSISYYLYEVWLESQARGYNFDKSKFRKTEGVTHISVSHGQLEYEFALLLSKLKLRNPAKYKENLAIKERSLIPHPLFFIIEGSIESWERIKEFDL